MYSELKKSNGIVPLTSLNKCVYHDQSETEVNTNDTSEWKQLPEKSPRLCNQSTAGTSTE